MRKLLNQYGREFSDSFTPTPLRSNADAITEQVIDTDNGFKIRYHQRAEKTVQAVHDAGSLIPKKTKGDGVRYMGSAPLIVCQIWAKECGAPVGSREFNVYARKKLQSGEYAKLKAHLK